MDVKHATILALLAVWALVIAPGCGGGGGGGGGQNGGGGNNANFAGTFTGANTSANNGKAAGNSVQITQSGASVTTVNLLDAGGQVIIGSGSGTVSGSTAKIVVTYPPAFGTSNVTLTINGSTVTGTFKRFIGANQVDSGTVNLTLSAVTTLGNAIGVFNGTLLHSGSNTPQTLTFTVAQNGNTLTITNGLTDGVNAFTGIGVIVGDTVGLVLSPSGTSDTIDMDGTLNGNIINGASWEPGTNSGNNGTPVTGTFTVTRPAPR